jgi:hypothetical protein
MNRLLAVLPAVLIAGFAFLQPASAQPMGACSLLPKEEVKKHLPWNDFLDSMPAEEEPIGSSGSSCNYPTVFIQVLPFSQGLLEAVRKQDNTEAVSGVGDEAYFHNNSDRYAELYVKVGERARTLQASGQGTIESLKPNVVNLARALIAKMG